jgi:hypothetical protein
MLKPANGTYPQLWKGAIFVGTGDKMLRRGERMQYDDSPSPSRISASSLILLVIFASAAALIVAAIVWRPWFDDGDPASTSAQPEATEPAPDVAAEPPVADAPAAEAPTQ